MSVFDLIILAILLALTLRGIWKGMVSQIVSVASYFVCWIVATRFGGLVAPTIPIEAPLNQVLAMAIIFLITLVAIRFAYAALEKLIKHWKLQKLNTLLGGVLGFAKGVLICLILTFFAVMFSETSRAVVFNSMSGFRLAQLISNIGVFVPKDSYEFVHTQLAQFQDKVDEAVPGQKPEMLPIQSSETMQKMLAQLQQPKEPQETTENRATSLLAALSKWWNGSKEDNTEGKTQQPAPGSSRESDPAILPPATTFLASPSTSPSVLPSASLPASSPLASTYTDVVQPATPQPAHVVEEFFVRRTEPDVPQSALPQLTTLLPSAPVLVPQPSSATPPLASLAPLPEMLSYLPEPSQLLPPLPAPHHVGSDLLLRNSTQLAKPDGSAKVFRPQ